METAFFPNSNQINPTKRTKTTPKNKKAKLPKSSSLCQPPEKNSIYISSTILHQFQVYFSKIQIGHPRRQQHKIYESSHNSTSSSQLIIFKTPYPNIQTVYAEIIFYSNLN